MQDDILPLVEKDARMWLQVTGADPWKKGAAALSADLQAEDLPQLQVNLRVVPKHMIDSSFLKSLAPILKFKKGTGNLTKKVANIKYFDEQKMGYSIA